MPHRGREAMPEPLAGNRWQAATLETRILKSWRVSVPVFDH